MYKPLLSVFLLASLVGCGDGDQLQGDCTDSGLASLGIDPLGRGDGIDLTESNYTGRCYQDDELEANRPAGRDPRVLAAEEAEAIAYESQRVSDVARAALDVARDRMEASFSVPSTPPSSTLSAAGRQYVTIVTVARFATEDAYQIGLALLSPEEPTTWQDIADHPDKFLQELATEFLEEAIVLLDSSAIADLAVEVLTAALKAEMLEFLKTARDVALDLFESIPESVREAVEPAEAVVDPAFLLAFQEAQHAYDEALEQSIADSQAAFAARIYAETAPSDLAPCDSEELRQTLEDAFCTGDFVNPITAEEEATIPGITASLDAYVADMCEAVALVCVAE